MPYTFAFYCSGHGLGHATRVVALALELLARQHNVYVCTNAPQEAFASVVDRGATYRRAAIDAGVVQPNPNDVAKQATLRLLQTFLDGREAALEQEVRWLREIRADAVLSDAAFLPCAAAHHVDIPSVIVSNFTFDSIYSYLFWEASGDKEGHIPPAATPPLVNRIMDDYSNASLLLRLPGAIPIPAFDTDVPLPASQWVDLSTYSFHASIKALLGRDPSSIPCGSVKIRSSSRQRKVVQAPLIARPISSDIYSSDARVRILSSAGVPSAVYDPQTAKILLVSFGGQSIPQRILRGPDSDVGLDLLPRGWIAIVTGLAPDMAPLLPANFYAAPIDIYVPDLVVLCNVVLGKLGYGTCSETVTTQTPLVYIPRPLFVEEFGLKRLMEAEGTAVMISRAQFDRGQWAELILEAWEAGREKKEEHRSRFEAGATNINAATNIAMELERFMQGQAR